MTIGELIRELSMLDPEVPVKVWNFSKGDTMEATCVTQVEGHDGLEYIIIEDY